VLVVVGVAYGLAQIGGSGGSTPSSAIITGRPWLGIEVSMPPGGGVIVSSVAPRGPAQRAGIAPGDVVLQVGNTAVSSPADVEAALQGMQPGQSVPITVLRGADSYATLATLTGAPAGASTP
jgi:S1-C subfamily serine protease